MARIAPQKDMERIPVNAVRYDDGVVKESGDFVVREHLLRVYIDQKEYIRIICTKSGLKELIYGFLFAEGIIGSPEDVRILRFENDMRYARVELVLPGSRADLDMASTMLTGLGGLRGYGTGTGGSAAAGIGALQHKNDAEIKIEHKRLIELMEEFNGVSELFTSTGGVHVCSLADSDGILYHMEDIGRHNAFDKVVGKSMIDCIPMHNKIIITSGRIPLEMILKARRCGIKIIVSRSAVTDWAIEAAVQSDITLCGFARGNRLNIYSGVPRIELET